VCEVRSPFEDSQFVLQCSKAILFHSERFSNKTKKTIFCIRFWKIKQFITAIDCFSCYKHCSKDNFVKQTESRKKKHSINGLKISRTKSKRTISFLFQCRIIYFSCSNPTKYSSTLWIPNRYRFFQKSKRSLCFAATVKSKRMLPFMF